MLARSSRSARHLVFPARRFAGSGTGPSFPGDNVTENVEAKPWKQIEGEKPLTDYDVQFHRSQLPSGAPNPAQTWLNAAKKLRPPSSPDDLDEDERMVSNDTFQKLFFGSCLIFTCGVFLDTRYKQWRMQPGNFVPHLDGVDAPQGSDNPAARYVPARP
jgi:hypothetical protein